MKTYKEALENYRRFSYPSIDFLISSIRTLLIITSGPDCDGSRLCNSLTKPCEDLPRPTVYPDGGFLSFLPTVSDDKHAIFVEENVKA